MIRTRLLINIFKATHRFNQVIEITLSRENATGPSHNPVSIRHKASTLRGAAFKDVHDVPDVVERELGLADAHAQAEQRGLLLLSVCVTGGSGGPALAL